MTDSPRSEGVGLTPTERDPDWRPQTAEDELRARVRQQEATGRLGLAALLGTDMTALMDQAAGVISEVLSAEYSEILELLPDGTGLLLRAGVGWSEGLVGQAAVGTNLESQAGYTLISRGPVIVEDLREERRFEGPPLLSEHGVVSGMTVTIYVHGHPYGVLGAHTAKKRTFTEDEVLFLQEVADVLGAAIEREQAERDKESLLGERTRWATAAERRFEFLAEASALLSTSTEYSTVLATAVRLTVPALADLCFVDIVEETEGSVTRFAVAHSDPEGGALARELQSTYRFDPSRPHGTARVYRTGTPELIAEVNEGILRDIARSPEYLDVLRRLRPGSYLCVPLRIAGRTLGAMGLVSSELGRYEADDLALAEGLAHCTALALDNARHHVSEAELVRELVRRAREDRPVIAPPRHREAPAITPRQMEVLTLLAAGRSTREIGGELYLSEATVRNHIRGLLQAFGAHSQLEVLARARELGVLP
jgi:GAF domain-containing protein